MKVVTSLNKLANKVSSPVSARGQNSDAAAANPGSATWMTKGTDRINAQVENVKLSAQRSFAPELRVKDGESKRIRFRANEPIGSLYRYSLKVNGNWTSVTMPPEGEDDPAAEAGLKPSLKVLWEVVDIDGYVDKKGKKHTMVPKFLLANVRLHEQLEMLKRKKGGDLTSFTIEISRTGTGTQTSYMLLPEDPEPMPELKKVPLIRNDAAKFYSPLPSAELARLVARNSPDTDN